MQWTFLLVLQPLFKRGVLATLFCLRLEYRKAREAFRGLLDLLALSVRLDL